MNYVVRRKGLPALVFALALLLLFVFGRAVATAAEIVEGPQLAPQEAAALPTVQFSPVTYTPGEGDTDVTLEVMLSGTSTETVMVDYTTVDDSALAGSDYTATADTLTFAPGETLKSFDVAITADLLDEDDESFTVELSNPISATLGVPNDVATVTITDNDPLPTVEFDPASYILGEGDGPVAITAILSAESGRTVTVDYGTSNDSAKAGQDYTATSDTLTFVPGDTSETFTITIADDSKDEPEESFNVNLSSEFNANLGASLASVTIQDNDTAPTVQFDSADYPIGEGGGSVNVIVTLNTPSEQTVTVDYATSDGTATAGVDYTAASNTLTFVPGDVSENFSVNISQDSLDEFDETINLTLSSPTNADLGVPNDEATITIGDDDSPPSVRFSSSSFDRLEDMSPATIGVQLMAPSGKPITVTYTTSNGSATAGSDYLATSDTLVFDPGQTSKNFEVELLDDAANEIAETVNLALSNLVNVDPGSPFNATLFILNDDPEPSVFFSGLAYDYLENVGSATITVTLSAASGKIVTVDYDTSDGSATAPSDYLNASNTLVFQPGQTTKTFPVTIINDSSNELTETVNLSLSSPFHSILGGPSEATLNILNDDGPEVQFSMLSYSVPEGIETATITATLSAEFDQVVTVNYATSNGTAIAPGDYGSTSGPLTFNPGVTDQTFTVSIVDDAIYELTETVNLSLSPVSNASCVSSCSAILNITDNDNPPEVFFSSAAFTETEGIGIAQIAVTLSPASALQVSVPYSTSDGTAIAPGDYTATNGTLIINAGLTSGIIEVPIVDNDTPEETESLNLFLGEPTTGAVLGSPSEATLDILDDDSVLVSFSSSTYQVDEDAGSATIDVSLSKSSDLQVTVDYATSDGTAVAGSGSEFSHWSGDLTGPNNPQTIVMDSDKVVTAHFVAAAPGASPITETVVLEPQAPNVVAYQETQTGGINNANSVSTSAPLTAVNGHLYLAAVTTRQIRNVTSISGLGLVWQKLGVQCGGRGTTAVEVWWALGNPSGSEVVTANVDGSPPNALALVVSRYSGADPGDPVGNVVTASTKGLGDTTCSGGIDSNSYAFNLSTSATNAVVYSAAAIRNKNHTPGALYTERVEFNPGGGAKVATQDRTVGAPATVTVDGSLSGDADWAVVALEIRPDSNGGTPLYTLTINTVGDGSVLLTPPGGVYEEDTVVQLTATGVGDYTPASGTLTFAPGVTNQSFEVPITDDGIDEWTETVNLALSSNPNNAGLGVPSTAVLNITDTTPSPKVQFDSTAYEVAEGDGTATFTVVLNARSEKTVSVNYASCGGSAAAGSDYSFTPGSLVFSPGQVSKTFNVVIIDDLSYEPPETLCVALNAPVNATVGPNSPAILTITSYDDPPPTVRFASSSYSVDEDAGTASIDVIVVPASGFPVSVDYATSDGTAEGGVDYTPVTGTLTFNPGQTTLSFTVPITDDIVAEPPVETVLLTLSNPVSATVGAPNPAQLGIFSTDSDPCVQFTISDKTVLEGTTAQINVELCTASQQLIKVDYETSDGTAEAGSDYDSRSGTLTFDPGVTVASIQVPIILDGVFEPDPLETFYLTLSNPINAVLGDPYTMTVKIKNVDDQVYRTFLPLVFKNFAPGEDNDDCDFAYPISPNLGYWFVPDDELDWYTFDTSTQANIVITMENYVPRTGDLGVYYGDVCTGATFIDRDYQDRNGVKTYNLDLGERPAGRYYVYVVTYSGAPLYYTESYRLTVHVD